MTVNLIAQSEYWCTGSRKTIKKWPLKHSQQNLRNDNQKDSFRQYGWIKNVSNNISINTFLRQGAFADSKIRENSSMKDKGLSGKKMNTYFCQLNVKQ
jgi:hypothetical protein